MKVFINSSHEFQSPQWESISKDGVEIYYLQLLSFSPRNGEVILKPLSSKCIVLIQSFSPRNGEIILKVHMQTLRISNPSFSPRNGGRK